MFTPGPASLSEPNIKNLGPAFGRGDKFYSVTERNVSDHFRKLTNIIVERYIDGYNFKMPRKENLFNKIFKKIYK